MGGLAGAVSYYSENETPDLIVVEVAEEAEAVLGLIDDLSEVCDAETKVLVIGAKNDVSLYRGLSRKGVSDYMVAPVTARQIYDVIEAACVDPDMPQLGRTISFIGSRGGVGSSCISHNTAWALSQNLRDDVVLVDLDITFGTAGLAFNLESRQGIDSLLADPDRLDEQLLERYMAGYDDYLKVLVSPANLDAQEGIVTSSLDALLQLVRLKAPYVVIDVPHRWAPWTKQVLVEADETVICGTLDLASLRDTKNLVDRLKAQRGTDSPVRVVLNHVGQSKKTELSPKDFENAIGEAPILSIAHDPALFGGAANNGQMVGQVNSRSKVSQGFSELATTLSGRQPSKVKKKGSMSLFSRKRA
jgi:pilus assembly protein CpaE